GVDMWWWLVDLARKNGRITSQGMRDDLMRLYGLIEINRLSIQRAKGGSSSAATPNIAKLTMSELIRSFRDVGLRIVGADGMLMGDSDSQSGGHVGELALFSPAPSIYGGTDQVQRNIIGERVLGLPREPGPPRDTPFSELPKN
ncbi:MAG: acyl-CoA dehydrogenase family protein, partial [Acidimicrobiaceae bacterium]|nr:acyl-CoA dehydrogenase family protein [Acidimicrobiaceae bacterium]